MAETPVRRDLGAASSSINTILPDIQYYDLTKDKDRSVGKLTVRVGKGRER